METTHPKYDSAEAARIVEHIMDNDFIVPEYILLFGSLAGGTRHSDATAYDLLIAVRETPEFDWLQTKRRLRYKMPFQQRKITYINLYIIPLSYIDSHNTPFLYFARSEGELLYCSERYHFRRPKYKPDFAKAYADARFHFDTFRTLGFELLEQANHELTETRNMRLAGMFAAQAAVYFYHTLYYVYHQMEFDSHDPLIMHERMRTLSTRLMLIYDDDNIRSVQTLASLKRYLLKSPYDKDFDVSPRDMAVHIERTTKAAEIIESCCGLRLELYQELGGM
ncbi:MAG: nucleotidyltransferase domain-containing protein [Alistipes sp.]|nr:nucleotidyltransferase domain-containing protein [Alistipes sp.]